MIKISYEGNHNFTFKIISQKDINLNEKKGTHMKKNFILCIFRIIEVTSRVT